MREEELVHPVVELTPRQTEEAQYMVLINRHTLDSHNLPISEAEGPYTFRYTGEGLEQAKARLRHFIECSRSKNHYYEGSISVTFETGYVASGNPERDL
jgi:hypothetical protein